MVVTRHEVHRRRSVYNPAVSGVFIGYRTSDTRAWALAIRDHLAHAFGDSQVFLDVDSIAAGPWRAQVETAVGRCAVFVLLIGPRWLMAADADAHPRLFAPDDVHRYEIATALAKSSTLVIPVLVDGARLPPVEHLPADIAGILARQAVEIGDQRDVRDAGLARLARLIDARLGHARLRRQATLATGAAVVVGMANSWIGSESALAAGAFLVVGCLLAALALVTARRMRRHGVKGAAMAILAVVLSTALVAGSLVRLALTTSPARVPAGEAQR